MSFVTGSASTTGVGGPPWWTWLIVGLAVAVALGSDAFVYHDARSRGLTWPQTATWIAGCVLMWVVIFPLWFVLRDDYVDGRLDPN